MKTKITDWSSNLLCVLFEKTQLEALVQFQLPHVPQLLQILPSPMKLIQQAAHFSDEVVCVSMRVAPVMVVVGIAASSAQAVNVPAFVNAASSRSLCLQPLQQPSSLRVQLLHGCFGRPFFECRMFLHEPSSSLQVPREITLGQRVLELLQARQCTCRIAGKGLKGQPHLKSKLGVKR